MCIGDCQAEIAAREEEQGRVVRDLQHAQAYLLRRVAQRKLELAAGIHHSDSTTAADPLSQGQEGLIASPLLFVTFVLLTACRCVILFVVFVPNLTPLQCDAAHTCSRRPCSRVAVRSIRHRRKATDTHRSSTSSSSHSHHNRDRPTYRCRRTRRKNWTIQ